MDHLVLITLKTVEDLTGFKKAFIYREMKMGRFPRPIPVGPKAKRWIKAEVLEWNAQKIAEARSPVRATTEIDAKAVEARS